MNDNGRYVLLVDLQQDRSERLSTAIEDAGYHVFSCPGPREPDYTCIAGRGHRCPLAERADIVVLTMPLASDVAMSGTPSWELMIYYMSLGKPVLVLRGDSAVTPPRKDEQVSVLAYDAGEEDVVFALDQMMRKAG